MTLGKPAEPVRRPSDERTLDCAYEGADRDHRGSSVARLERGVGVRCSICAHPARAEIDEALIAGASTPSVARDFGVGRSSVARHAAGHLAGAIAQGAQRREEASAVAILAKATELYEHCAELLVQAGELVERSPDSTAGITAATRVIRETRATLELIARALDVTMRSAPQEPVLTQPSSLDAVLEQMHLRRGGGRVLADGTIQRVPPCPQCGHQPEVQRWLRPMAASPELMSLAPDTGTGGLT